jgi:hypothetical protein
MKARLLLGFFVAFSATGAIAEDLATKMIMALDVNPGAVAFWAGGNDPAENESAYATDARWAAAVKGAQTMQAKGRLLQSGGIVREGAWSTFAEMMIQVSAEGEIAARARDSEKAFEIGGRLYDACNGCHKTYVPRVVSN